MSLVESAESENPRRLRLIGYAPPLFALDWGPILWTTPVFAIAGYAGWGDEPGRPRATVWVKLPYALITGLVLSWVFWWAVSVLSSPIPWNVIGLIVAWFLGAIAVGSILTVARRNLFGRGGESGQTATAKRTLDFARGQAFEKRMPYVKQDEFITDFLKSICGVTQPTPADIATCRWPEDVALAMVESFFVAGAPLNRLEDRHLKYTGLRAYMTIEIALLAALAGHVTPVRHQYAVRYFKERGGGDEFDQVFDLARNDIAETVAKLGKPAVPLYISSTYVRTLLDDANLPLYFTDATSAEAVERVRASYEAGLARLAGLS